MTARLRTTPRPSSRTRTVHLVRYFEHVFLDNAQVTGILAKNYSSFVEDEQAGKDDPHDPRNRPPQLQPLEMVVVALSSLLVICSLPVSLLFCLKVNRRASCGFFSVKF